MSLIILEDDKGRECALDPERIELVCHCLLTWEFGKPRTYGWNVHLRGGRCVTIPCLGPGAGPHAETLTQFFQRLDNA